MKDKITRREMLRLSALVGAGTLAATFTGSASTLASQRVLASQLTGYNTPGAPAAVNSVPRHRTLIISAGSTSFTWVGMTNPVGGMNHQEGGALLWAPLFYYSVFADKDIPWLAESGTYNADYTTLTIKLRSGVTWSDGVPITSGDVKWTLDAYKANVNLDYHAQIHDFVAAITTPDDSTAVIFFDGAQPRFKFEILSYKFDTGMCPLPAHVFEAAGVAPADIHTYAGGDNMPHSGMFNVAMSAEQLLYDINPDWWGFRTGFQPRPDIERVVFIPYSNVVGPVQRIANNECDSCLDLSSGLIHAAIAANAKVTTHTGHDEPLGYVDWWPNSLWMNTLLYPYSNADVRWAMNYAIDRDAIDTAIYLGAKVTTIYPYPEYPALQPYLTGAKPIADGLGVHTFDLTKTAQHMTTAGFTKDSDGFWVKNGSRVNATINGFESIHSDIVPTLVQMLRNGGFEASANFGGNAYQNMADGVPGLYLFGHGASVIDPYATLDLYHSRYSAPIGTTADGNCFSRYNNPAFDAIVDTMRPLAPGDPSLVSLFNQAMTIYWTDMIDIPIRQWLHRIPYNQTYWTNWPTRNNPYLNGAYWHWTFPLLVLGLKTTMPARAWLPFAMK